MLLFSLQKNTLKPFPKQSTALLEGWTTIAQNTLLSYSFLAHFFEMKNHVLIFHSYLTDSLHEVNHLCYSLSSFRWSSPSQLSAPYVTVSLAWILKAPTKKPMNSKSSIKTRMFKNNSLKLDIQKLHNTKTLHLAKNSGMSRSSKRAL